MGRISRRLLEVRSRSHGLVAVAGTAGCQDSESHRCPPHRHKAKAAMNGSGYMVMGQHCLTSAVRRATVVSSISDSPHYPPSPGLALPDIVSALKKICFQALNRWDQL